MAVAPAGVLEWVSVGGMIVISSPPRGGTGREPPPPQLASPVYANATSAMDTIIFRLCERVVIWMGLPSFAIAGG